MGMAARIYVGRLQEISNYLDCFVGQDSDAPLTKGDLINLLNQMIPALWNRNLISINFQPSNKTITEAIEYMEKLVVLGATGTK